MNETEKHVKHKEPKSTTKQSDDQVKKELNLKLSGQPINLTKRPAVGSGRASFRSMSVSGPAPRRPMSALPLCNHQTNSHHVKQLVGGRRPQSADQSFKSRKLAAKFPSRRPLLSESSQSSRDDDPSQTMDIVAKSQENPANEPLTFSSLTDTDEADVSDVVPATKTHNSSDDGEITNRSAVSLSKYLIDANSIFKDFGVTYPVPSMMEATWTDEELIRYCDKAESNTESARSDEHGQSEKSLGQKILSMAQERQSAMVSDSAMQPGVATKPPLPMKKSFVSDSLGMSEAYLSTRLIEAERQTDLLLQQLADHSLNTDSSDVDVEGNSDHLKYLQEEIVYENDNGKCELYIEQHSTENNKIHPINEYDNNNVLSLDLDKHFLDSDRPINELGTNVPLVGHFTELFTDRYENEYGNTRNQPHSPDRQYRFSSNVSECKDDGQISNRHMRMPECNAIISPNQQSSRSCRLTYNTDGAIDCLSLDNYSYRSNNDQPRSLCCEDTVKSVDLYKWTSQSSSSRGKTEETGLDVQSSQSLFNLDRYLLHEKALLFKSSTSINSSSNVSQKTNGIPPLWEIIDDIDSSRSYCNESVKSLKSDVNKAHVSTRSTRSRQYQLTSQEARSTDSETSSLASQVAKHSSLCVKPARKTLRRSKSVETVNKAKRPTNALKPCRSLNLEPDSNRGVCNTYFSRTSSEDKTSRGQRNRQRNSTSSKESRQDTASLSSSSETNQKPPVPIKPSQKPSSQPMSTSTSKPPETQSIQSSLNCSTNGLSKEDCTMNSSPAYGLDSEPASSHETTVTSTLVTERLSNPFTSVKPTPRSPPATPTSSSYSFDDKPIRDQDARKKVSFFETNRPASADMFTTLANVDNNTNYLSHDDMLTKTNYGMTDHVDYVMDVSKLANTACDQIDSDRDAVTINAILSGRSLLDSKQPSTTLLDFDNLMKDSGSDFDVGAFTQDSSSMADIDEILASTLTSGIPDKTAYDDIINILQVLEGEESSSLLCLDAIINEKPDIQLSKIAQHSRQISARKAPAEAGTNLAEIFSYLDHIDKESVVEKAEKSIKMSQQLMKSNKSSNHGMLMPLDRGDGPGLFQNTVEVQPVKLEELLGLGVVDLAHMVFTLRFQLEDKTKSVKLLKGALNEEREKREDLAREAERNLASRLREQKDQYESTVARHQKFIDQLISDKKSLTGKVESVVSEMKTLEERHARNVKTLQERHTVEIQRAKDMQAANNKMRMDRWVDTKTKKIKEQTVKGLEPELARMMTSHAQEVSELRQLHQHELREVELRAARKTEQAMEQLRQQLHQENHEALAREREALKLRVEKAVEQEEMLYQEHRHRLLNEVKREKQRLEEELIEAKRDNARVIERVRQEHQDALEASNRRHATDLRNLREEMEAQREAWAHSYKKQKESELHTREQELWEELKKERDRQIDTVVAQLAEETEQAKKEVMKGAEKKIRKLTEKYDADLQELEMSEQTAKAKYSEAKTQVITLEDTIAELRASHRQLDKELQEERKISGMLSSERSQNKEVVRQEFLGKMTALEQELASMRTELATSKTKFDVELATLRTVKEREMQAVYSRVKTTVAQRDITIEELTGKCCQLEELVEAQRKEYLLK